jgi:cytochrome c biogenesis protein CcmG/thiol:disulfide interchange protein DsbE
VSAARPLFRRPTLAIAVVIGLVMVVFVAVLATRGNQSGTVTASPLVGQAAPALWGTDIMTGKPVSLAAERGHYVVVTFFASWCGPCVTETPQLVAFLFAERKIHASVLGVIYDDSIGNARTFLQKYGASWPALTDTNGNFAANYGVNDPPESFVVSPSGRVVAKVTGPATERQLLQIIGLAGAS